MLLVILIKGLSSLEKLLQLEIYGFGLLTYLPMYLCNKFAHLKMGSILPVAGNSILAFLSQFFRTWKGSVIPTCPFRYITKRYLVSERHSGGRSWVCHLAMSKT